MKEDQVISVVVPVYNEHENLPHLNERLVNILTTTGHPFEILYVDDGSVDGTDAVIRELSNSIPNIKGILLSRNFGHQIAITAGLDAASGDIIITMDGDLQHPPEVIPELLKAYKTGFDVVNTSREEHGEIGMFKKYSSKFFYSLFNVFADLQIEPSSSDFRLFSRRFLNEFKRLGEKDRFIRGMVKWIGFPQISIRYTAESRYKGKSKYSLRKMLSFSLNGITSFSSKPLRIPVVLGLLFCLISLFYSIYVLYCKFTEKNTEGWTSLIFMVMFLGGVQLISFGIVSEYILRIFNQSKGRPLYIIKEQIK